MTSFPGPKQVQRPRHDAGLVKPAPPMKRRTMRNLKISRQLILLVAGLIAAFAVATAFEIRASVNAIYAERYTMLRSQVETAVSLLDSYYQRQKSGELSEEEAKSRAYSAIVKLKFTPDGYFYGYDYNYIQIFHPNPKSIGKSFKDVKDKNGFAFLVDVVEKGRAGGGFTDFEWTKPGQPDDQMFPKTGYSQAFEPWKVVVGTGVYTDDLRAQIVATVLNAASVVIAMLVIGMAAAWFVIRGITRPLAAVHGALQAVAEENTQITIPHTDMRNEVGLMAKATQALQDKVRERHQMAEREAQHRAELDGERQANARLQGETADKQAHAVSTIGTALNRLAQGDLTVRCADLGTDYATLRANFNEAVGQLETALSRVSAKSTEIGSAKEQIRSASGELARRTEQQAASLEETAAAIDELNVAVRQTADGARRAAQEVHSVNDEAVRSDAVVAEAIEAMGGIAQSSEEITKIIGVIDEIAFQTNLLALNAGVEAARAGESGKGFAVVAQEVRELAQRSAAAAKEIKAQISRSSGQVENGVRLVGEAGEALKRISTQIQTANEIVSKIAHGAAEQNTTLHSIASAMGSLDVTTQKNAAIAEETTASAEMLARDAEELIDLVSNFRVSGAREQQRYAA